ncbi:hypothetical protein HBH75_238040 [Parastagonospora nodorum]|nr:hypothetical protein HBH75_238040 [Parastagonospora nodorum]
MCAKDDFVGRKGPLLTSTQTWEVLSNHVDTFSLDFAFSFANILLLIAFIISYRLFADKLVYALNRATVVLIIILVNKTQLLLILGDIAAWLVYVTIGNLTLLAEFIPITKIRDPLLKTLENAAKSGILLACADGRTRQCYLTICAILADYEEQVLLTSVKKNRYCTRCTRCLDKGHDDFVYLVNCFEWKHYNFNIYVSLATDTLHLLLKGLVIKMLDFMQDMLDDIYPSSRKTWDNSTTLAIIQQLIAVVSLLFVSKAPFALHFICAVCDLHALTHIIQDIRMYGALDSICTRANSEAHYITIVKQFYSMTNKKEYILVICPLPFCRLRWLILGIQPYSTKLPLSEVAANIAISDFTHAVAVFDCLDVDLSWVSCMSVQIYSSIKCWRSSGKRYNDPEHCDEEIGLWRRDYVWVQEFEHGDNRRQSRTVTDNRKYMAYIGAFSKVLLFNNNGQIDNTTGMLSVPFKFYDLSTIICLVHLVLRDLPDLTTHEYNCLYSLTFNIDLLRTLREYRRKRTRNN